MTELQQQLSAFALKAMLQAGSAVSASFIKGAIRTAFAHVALTDGDLRIRLADLEANNLISGTDDPVLGTVWGLTPTGKIRAQQLS